jgi:hypothetical protein
MIKADWSKCPHCLFPALYSALTAHVASEAACPMCEQPLEAKDIVHMPESDIKLGEETSDGTNP